MQLVRAFYCDDEDYKDMYNFNNDPSKFSFEALLAKLKVRMPQADASKAGSVPPAPGA